MSSTENLVRIKQQISQYLADNVATVMIHSYLASEGITQEEATDLITKTQQRMQQTVLASRGEAAKGTGDPFETVIKGDVPVLSFADAFNTKPVVSHTHPPAEPIVKDTPALDKILGSAPTVQPVESVAVAPTINRKPASREEIPTVATPFPIWEGDPCFIDLGDVKVRVAFKSMSNPNIIVFEDVLTHEECDAMIALAEPILIRSTTVANNGGSEVHQARTSSGASFIKAQTPVIARVEERLAKLAQWPVEKGEPIQVLNYQPGQEYKPHNDYFDPMVDGSYMHITTPGNRVATMIMYLNDVEEGGSTAFPQVGVHVMPKKGSVVFFSYGRPHEDSKSLHGGSPVVKGQKWIATKWLRERAYV